MSKKYLPPIETLRKLLVYNYDDSKLYWLPRPAHMFKDSGYGGRVGAMNRWNSRCAGKEVSPSSYNGYLRFGIQGNRFRVHRVVWAMHYGEWPDGEIDHINHDRADNSIDNLRLVTRFENSKNLSLYKNNKSGNLGVREVDGNYNWEVSITFDGTLIKLGLFLDYEAAIFARDFAEKKYGFHVNHGDKS